MKKYGKHTLLGWSWRILLGIALTPIFLLLLLFVLIYTPPVQQFLVDKTAEMLSEGSDMEVKVERVRLKFPLDLSVEGLVAVENGDTVLAAGALDLSMKALPLLKMQAEIDGFHLYDAQLNLKNLIDACIIKGNLAELSLDSHTTDIDKGNIVLNKLLLRDADLQVLLNDSVPEDTTTIDWRVQLDDLNLQRVKLAVLLTPNADSTWVESDIGTAQTKAYIDLKEGAYRVDKLELAETNIGYDLRKEPRLPHQLDVNHLLFKDFNLQLDSLSYVGDDFSMNLRQLAATEQSGLAITEATGRLTMDSLQLLVPFLHVKTADSDLSLAYRMDMNAFEDTNPGTFAAVAEGQLGKGDIIYFTHMGGEGTQSVCDWMAKQLPARPVEARLKTEGNLNTLEVKELYAKIPTLALLEGEATLWDVATDDFALQSKAQVEDAHGAKVTLDGRYVMASDAYKADLDISHLTVNHYVPMDSRIVVTGSAEASGRGFDFLSPSTMMDATLHLSDAYLDSINLSHTDASVSLKGGQLLASLAADNDQVQTDLSFDGSLKRHLLEGVLNLNLPFVDVKSMGFSDDALRVSTQGTMQFSYNLDKLFRVDSHIETLAFRMGNDSIHTDAFHLYAEALKDTTSATLRTGDLSFSFFTPYNVFNLMPKVERLQKETVKQFKSHEVDLNELKTYLPELSVHATAGRNNSVTDILKTFGIQFDEFVADVEASPVQGLMSSGHVYAFRKDSVTVDTAFFDIAQDSTHIDYHVGVRCDDQPRIPAFRAYLDGYVMANAVDAHITYFNKKDEKGVDFGVHGFANDTCVHYNLYPAKPIFAYREFLVNPDNHIITRPNRPIMADVRLEGTTDSCYVALYADESDAGKQIANILAKNLNIKEMLSVVPIPGLPSMDGMLQLDARYVDQGENFLVEGSLDADRFAYQGMSMGNIASQFTYTPRGETLHDIDASIAFNGADIAVLKGEYNAEGAGSLDADLSLIDLPLSLASPFVPKQTVSFSGTMAGHLKVTGPTDALLFNGALLPNDVHAISHLYSLDLALANDSILFNNSRINFTDFNFYGADENPLTLNGYVDFSNFDEILLSLSLTGRNFKLIGAERTNKKLLFGDMYGDIFTRVIGSTKDLSVRGLIRVLPTTNITYILSETALYQTDRLEDIVTFVDFNAPPPPKEDIVKKTYMGLDMNLTLNIEDGARLNGEFSADRQSYVAVQGGGSITMSYTPEGVFSMMGRYTINEGEMKYELPVIPLKTFTIKPGSFIEFIGKPANPMLNIAATERVKSSVGQSDGSSRTVAFDVGLKITNTLEDMGLEFTIEAPEDISVQNELAGCSLEERNKLAVGMLATGMYMSGSNSKGFAAGNTLNNFLEDEINKIAGNALSTMVNVSVGLNQTVRDDGTRRTDYSFKFSRKFFSDRLNVVIGGKVSSDNNTLRNESGAYIDDVSMEWRLDNGGTQYIRLFHEKDYSSLIEGELDKNGVGVVLRKKVDKLSDLLIWRKKKEETEPSPPTNKQQ